MPLMLENAELIAFIPVSNLQAARRFYESTLGLRVTDENLFAVVVDANGTMLRLTEVSDLTPQPFTIAGWQVPDIDATIDALEARPEGSGNHPVGTWWPGLPTPMATRCR
jgi:catechol 2,3-dioxygenase-like lactoylglutathione lyase family enzyme